MYECPNCTMQQEHEIYTCLHCRHVVKRIPWKCTDCLDTGVAGRGTQQDFCNCDVGIKFKSEVEEEALKGLPLLRESPR